MPPSQVKQILPPPREAALHRRSLRPPSARTLVSPAAQPGRKAAPLSAAARARAELAMGYLGSDTDWLRLEVLPEGAPQESAPSVLGVVAVLKAAVPG